MGLMLLPRAEQNRQDPCTAFIHQPLLCQSCTPWLSCPLRGIPGSVPRHDHGNYPETAGWINTSESVRYSSAPGIDGDDVHHGDGDG